MAEDRTPVLREIRVHGVSGTTPEELLDLESADDVTRIAGDDTTGFWRRTPDGQAKLPTWMRPQRLYGMRWEVEAYSWGALTSGARGSLSRAGWLLLTPFALANIASWARPALSLPGKDSFSSFRSNPAAALVIRLSALALTLLLVAGAAMVSIDLVAFQCFRGGDLLCPSLPSQAQFLADAGWETPGRRIAIGAVGPLLALAVVWWLGRATAQRYEDVPDRSEGTDTAFPSARSTATYPHLLEATAMWNGRGRWRWLSSVHLLGGLGGVLVLTGSSIRQITGDRDLLGGVGVVAGGLLLLVAMAGAAAASDGPEAEGPRKRRHIPPPDERTCAQAQTFTGVAALATITYLVWVGWSADTGFEFVDLDIFPLAITVLVALAGVGVVLGLVMWKDPAETRTWPARAIVVACVFGGSIAGVLLIGQDVDWWWVVVLGGAVAALLVHRLLSDSDTRREWGFRGAAPGVFLGGGLFVALLFTTSAVVGVVVWLAGPSNLARMPTTYAAPPLCVDHGAESTDLDCSTLIATGDLELVDGVILGGASGRVIQDGRLSVESLHADDTSERTVSVPSLRVGQEARTGGRPGLTLVVESEDGVSTRSSDPGSPDVATYTVSERRDGTRRVIVEPGVVLEVRDPPNTGALVTPAAIRSFAAVFPFVTLGALGIAAVSYGLSGRMRGQIAQRVDKDVRRAADTIPPANLPEPLSTKIRADARRYTEMGGEDVDPEKRDRLVRAMCRLRRSMAFARRGETLLSRISFVAGVSMLLAVVNAAGQLAQAEQSNSDSPGSLDAVTQWAIAAGLYLCVGAAIGLLALGSQVHRDSAFRRPVGILWDLSCFWPRVAHPFSPPCYAERAVPDLYERLQLATTGPDRAILSGHSLGSFLSVAAIFRLQHTYPPSAPAEHPAAPGPRSDVALLTYGSQLRYYWGRVFPGAFGSQVLGNSPATPQPGRSPGRLTLSRYEYPDSSSAEVDCGRILATTLAGQLGGKGCETTRWLNLYRLTDPLGFTVLGDDTGTDDDAATRNWLDRPVSEIALTDEGDPTPPALLGHSGYPQSSDYHQWIWTLSQRMR